MPPVTLGPGRLHFPHLGYRFGGDALSAPYTATAKIDGDIYEHFVNTVLFDMRVHWIVGYNPQKLLPAPSFEREMMQTVCEWAQSQKLDPHMEFSQSVFNTLSRDGEVTYTPTGRYVADPESFSGDFTKLEIRYLSATFLAESAGGMPTPRGRIEIFDYEDGTVINLEGAGELPGLIDESFWTKAVRQQGKTNKLFQMKPTVEPIQRQPSYLDHDPTKKHRRRRRGK